MTNKHGSGEPPPLRECVREAVETYFQHLGDQSCNGLYQLVIREVEAPLLKVVMEHTNQNQSLAAEVLGVSRGTLRKKLREYDLL